MPKITIYTAMLCLAAGQPVAAAAVLAGIPMARLVTRAIALRTLS